MKTTRALRDQWVKEVKDASGDLPLWLERAWVEAVLSRFLLMADDLNTVEETVLQRSVIVAELDRAFAYSALVAVLSCRGSLLSMAQHLRHRAFTALDLNDPLETTKPVGSEKVPSKKFDYDRELEKLHTKSLQHVKLLYLREKERRMEAEKTGAQYARAYARLEKDMAETVRRIMNTVHEELRAYADENFGSAPMLKRRRA